MLAGRMPRPAKYARLAQLVEATALKAVWVAVRIRGRAPQTADGRFGISPVS